MKIGILTYHFVPNFGANLQVLSTVCYLRNNGFEPIVINWIPNDLKLEYEKKINKDQIEIHESFIKQYLPLTNECKTDEDIIIEIRKNEIKGIIVGSDALWHHVPEKLLKVFSFRRMKIVKFEITSDRKFPNPFWGSFHKDIPNIPICAFSVSSQNMPYKMIKGKFKVIIGESLNQFKFISVRDNWTKKLVEYFTNKTNSPDVTPDPVFAFNSNVGALIPTKEEIYLKFNLPEDYILLSFFKEYTLPERWISDFEHFASLQDIKCIALPTPNGLGFKSNIEQINLPLSPMDWYALIKYSKGYVGNNMHPIVIALHNSVPCFSFDQYGKVFLRYFINEKSSKLYHILSHYNLKKNRISINNKFIRFPKPKTVLSKINKFDKTQCSTISKVYEKHYNKSMESLLNVIKYNIE